MLSYSIEPVSNELRPASIFINEVLPDPFGPEIFNTSPEFNSNDKFSNRRL
jgi:hypothetical protein